MLAPALCALSAAAACGDCGPSCQFHIWPLGDEPEELAVEIEEGVPLIVKAPTVIKVGVE
jgi:hypothetical protein